MRKKFLLFGICKNNIPWEAHSLLRLSDCLFKKILLNGRMLLSLYYKIFFHSLSCAFLSLFKIIMDLVICQIVNIGQHICCPIWSQGINAASFSADL